MPAAVASSATTCGGDLVRRRSARPPASAAKPGGRWAGRRAAPAPALQRTRQASSWQQRRAVLRRAGDFEWSNLSVQDFEEVVKECPTPLMVEFYTSWCPSCRQLSIAMQRLAPSMEDHVTFEKIDGEANPDLAAHFQVGLLPTLILFRGQGSLEQLDRHEGRLSKQDLELWLRSNLRIPP